MWRSASLLAVVAAAWAGSARGEDVVRLGNLKFAHYGAISYMKELGPKYGLRVEERVFPKGLDILPAIVAGEIDVAASAADAAIAGRAAGAPVYAVAGFARGGVRIVGRADLALTSVAQLKGRKVGVPRGGAQELALSRSSRRRDSRGATSRARPTSSWSTSRTRISTRRSCRSRSTPCASPSRNRRRRSRRASGRRSSSPTTRPWASRCGRW